jgi:preprotein translocase subunit SecY
MFEKLRIVFTIPELRRKILLTLALLAVYRLGFHIPLPMINQATDNVGQGDQNEWLERVSVFAASDLREATIFGLGIMPYISASIILQLLGSVYKPLEELRKEGETGRKKINDYTRWLTVFICLIQSFFYLQFALMNEPARINPDFYADGATTLYIGWQIAAVLIMTCGTVFLMWVGEQIDEYGIGNGISLLIMAGIVARMPRAMVDLLSNMRLELTGMARGQVGVETLIVLVVLFVSVVAGVVFITLGQRRIATQNAKFMRGRKMYGGNRQFLPLKINQAGVMPIIFASSLLMIPAVVCQYLASAVGHESGAYGFFSGVSSALNDMGSYIYNMLYIGLIFFFCFFWTAITFNPKEMSEQLKDMGTFIPGYRPGKRTADYLEKVMTRITYVGAGFLALVAIVPTIVYGGMGVPYSIAAFYGGTGLLIAVSVAFDLVQKIDAHLVMRNYQGLLED